MLTIDLGRQPIDRSFAESASDEDDHLDIAEKKLAKRQARRGIATKYWTPAVHNASFALPRYAEIVVEQAMIDGRNDRIAAKNGRSGKVKSIKKTR